jgi:hypothetical protein
MRIRTRIEDRDCDENDVERVIPVGTLGTAQPIPSDDALFNVLWDNGAWTIWTVEEILRDAEKVED